MELIRLVIFIFTIIFSGYNLLYLMTLGRIGLSVTERISLSYGLGIGAMSLWMILLFLCGRDFRLGYIIIMPLIMFAMNILIFFKKRVNSITELSFKRERGRVKFLDILLISAIAFEIFYVFFLAFIKPLEAYDAIAIYAIKAKIFYLAGGIPADFFTRLGLIFPHPDYPLNIPLAETLSYIFSGNLNDQLVKTIFPLYYTAILMFFYCAVRRFSSVRYSLVFTFLLATVPQFAAYGANGYLDLPLACYVFLSALLLFRWFEDDNGKASLLVISAFVMAMAAQTKNEGLMYCVINLVILSLFFMVKRRSLWPAVGYIFMYMTVIVVINLPLLLIKKSANLVNSDLGAMGMSSFEPAKILPKLNPIIYEFQKQFFGPKKWNILWPAASIILAFNYKKALSGVGGYIALFLALALCGYVLSYLIVIPEVRWVVSRTISRFLLHFLPLFIYWVAYTLKDEVKS